MSTQKAALPPHLWSADTLASVPARVLTSGHAALDAELPGGGWPLGALIEVLHPSADIPLWPLLLPALAAHQQTEGGRVVLVNPPHEPFAPALQAAGLAASALLWLRADNPAAQLWGAEQALRCADAPAVLAWLPRARVPELRRLHLAAAQRARVLLLALRPDSAAGAASPALLRLHAMADQADALRVDILKRRGPPLVTPLTLPALAPHLHALLAAEHAAVSAAAPPASAEVLLFEPTRAPAAPGTSHAPVPLLALDRPPLAA